MIESVLGLTEVGDSLDPKRPVIANNTTILAGPVILTQIHL